MKKTYYLYLDESGDFNKDLKDKNKNECLVGGYLVKKEDNFTHLEARKIVADTFRKICPEKKDLSDEDAFKEMNHATDLKVKEELKNKKAEVMAELFTGLKNQVKFVIFENYNKTDIGSSSQTYLNILVEGVIQLFSKLVGENMEDAVILEVTAGYRVNTSGEEFVKTGRKNYIDINEYERRIQERLALEKVKRSNLFKHRESRIHFCLESDKNDHFLVPSDYICNFRLTRNSSPFKREYQNGKSYSQYLETFYDKNYMFSLIGNQESERVHNYIDNQAYDSALFDLCTGLIENEENRRTILSHIKGLKQKQIQNIFAGLSVYFNNVVGVERNIDTSIGYIKKAEEILDEFLREGFPLELYRMDMKLYALSVYNHCGDLGQMERLFGECKQELKDILLHAENLDYVFMYYNRYAVYLYDIFSFEEENDLLEELIEKFDAYELILCDLPEMNITKEEIRSTQLGKLLGTQVQCYRQRMKLEKMKDKKDINYEKVAEISDRAIENFTLESDKERQYQYRMQVELEAGHFDEAEKYFKKGWKLERWEDIFQPNRYSDFGMYHFTFFMERLAREQSYRKEARKMVNKCKDNETKLFASKGFPGFISLANIAKTMAHLQMDVNKIRKYYRKALETELHEETKPLFRLFMLMLHAEYVGWLLENKRDAEKEISLMAEALEQLNQIKQNLPKTIQTLCHRLAEILQIREPKAYYEYAANLQY